MQFQPHFAFVHNRSMEFSADTLLLSVGCQMMTIKKTRMINRRALKLGIAGLAEELQEIWCDNDLYYLPGTQAPNQDGGEHMENQNAPKWLFQQLQRQVQELLERESSQDGLLSASQLKCNLLYKGHLMRQSKSRICQCSSHS